MLRTPHQLFVRRLRDDARFQWRAWRSAFDWIVGVYLLLPALAVFGYQYWLWWTAPPAWLELYGGAAAAVLLTLAALSGRIRFYLEEADQLFVFTRPAWRRSLMRAGLAYSAVVHAALAALAVAILAPVLVRQAGLSAAEAVLLGLLTALLRTGLAVAAQWLERLLRGWRRIAAQLLLHLLGAGLLAAGWLLLLLQPAYAGLYAALLAAALLGLAHRRLQRHVYALQDAAEDHKLKLRFTSFLIGQAMPRPPVSSRRRPQLFRSSNRLFRRRSPAAGLAEAAVKAFLRNPASFRLYLQLAFLSTGAMAVLPAPAKWMLWVGGSFMLAYLARLGWKETLAARYLQLFPRPDALVVAAGPRAVAVLVLPPVLLMSIVLGAFVFPPWGALLLLPAGAVLGIAASYAMTSIPN
ncbi:ABC transporter permease [Paenibacillus sp. J31TS4]|uniref:ABC transporter permease n=1 Tax=Paenibacillus sp. J31TS4 TaxID=2807195 RepID=UPI001B07181E|nr:ABC transporter permease [Paenibacillus sp. J31TS4]GIP41052.1 ABC transporter permease [Paenibacillus sp. J31TS4]